MKSLGRGGNLHDGVAQWIERQFAELNVAGSSPVTVAFLFLALSRNDLSRAFMAPVPLMVQRGCSA